MLPPHAAPPDPRAVVLEIAREAWAAEAFPGGVSVRTTERAGRLMEVRLWGASDPWSAAKELEALDVDASAAWAAMGVRQVGRTSTRERRKRRGFARTA